MGVGHHHAISSQTFIALSVTPSTRTLREFEIPADLEGAAGVSAEYSRGFDLDVRPYRWRLRLPAHGLQARFRLGVVVRALLHFSGLDDSSANGEMGINPLSSRNCSTS